MNNFINKARDYVISMAEATISQH